VTWMRSVSSRVPGPVPCKAFMKIQRSGTGAGGGGAGAGAWGEDDGVWPKDKAALKSRQESMAYLARKRKCAPLHLRQITRAAITTNLGLASLRTPLVACNSSSLPPSLPCLKERSSLHPPHAAAL